MADQIIRDELLQSERWLDLPSDTDRLAFIGLRLRADDFGNMENGSRRIFRFLQTFTQLKTEEAASAVISHLLDADLIRFYKSGNPERQFIHIPRTRPSGSYLVRKCPPSPWCDSNILLGKHVRSVRNQGLAKNLPVTSPEHNKDIPVTSQERNPDVPQGIGKGKGKGKGVGVGLRVLITPEIAKPKPEPKPRKSAVDLIEEVANRVTGKPKTR